jgi:hypothetical protein
MKIIVSFIKLLVYIVVVTIEYCLKFLLDLVTYIKKWFNN